MLKEYALDPACLSDWSTFRYLIENFGVPQGRLIAKFSGRWVSMVYANCGLFSFKQKQILTIELNRIKKQGLYKTTRPYDGTLEWLDNALRQQSTNPFHAIISTKNDTENQVLDAAEITATDPLWGVQRTLVVPRNAAAMAEVMRTFFAAAKRIIFIDPHFGPENARHRRPFQEFLRVAAENRTNCMPAVEFHTQVKSTEEIFRDECHEKLVSLIPAGLTVRFVRWTSKVGGQPLHNRYILTDLGGISFQHGLDEGRAGETDDVALLDRESYEQRWAEYVGDNPAFDLKEEPFELS